MDSIEIDVGNILGCYSGQKGVWILDNIDKNVYFFNPDSKQMDKYECTCGLTVEQREYNWVVETKRGIYLLPAFGDVISKKENTGIRNIYQCEACEGQKVFNPVINGDMIIALPYSYEYAIIINDDQVFCIDIVLSELAREIVSHCFAEALDEIGIVKENKAFSLSDYLSYI